MDSKDFMEVRVDIKDTEIVEKLEILKLERGISSNSFIIKAIAEKLQRDGYLQGGALKHKPKEIKKKLSDVDQIRDSWMRITMRKR